MKRHNSKARQMNPDDKRTLLRIIANVEVLWTPFRLGIDGDGRALTAVEARRDQYRAGRGVRVQIGGDHDSRQRGYLILKRLESGGYIKVSRGHAQRRGVVLDDVDACLTMTPNFQRSEAWEILARLNDLRDDRKVLRQGDGIIDHDAAGLPANSKGGKRLARFVHQSLPLLIHGYLETDTDMLGYLAWAVTDAGRDALSAGRPKKRSSDEFDPELGKFYREMVAQGLADRESWVPDKARDLAIPLSATLWTTIEEDEKPIDDDWNNSTVPAGSK